MKTMPAGPFPVRVSLCLCERDWRRSMREVGLADSLEAAWPDDDEEATTKMITLHDDSLWLVAIFTPSMRERPLHERFGLICHEAAHLWQEVRDHCVIKVADREVEAYCVQWYTAWLARHLHAQGWLDD